MVAALIMGAAIRPRAVFVKVATVIPRCDCASGDDPKDQTSDVQLHIGESRDSGFARFARAPE
jgi:hypothetical protein